MPFTLPDYAQPLYGNSWMIRVSFDSSKMSVHLSTNTYEEAGVCLREICGFNDSNGQRTFYNHLFVAAIKPNGATPVDYKLTITCNDLDIHSLNIPLDGRFICIEEQCPTAYCKKEYDFVVFKDDIEPHPLATLLEDDEWYDFELIVKPAEGKVGGSVRMNKSILAAYSPVFKSMLSGHWKESKQGYVELPTELTTLEAFKNYVYTGQVPQDIEQVKNLLLFGSTYMIINLEESCTVPFMDNTNLVNVCEMLEFAVKNNCKNLSKKLMCKTKPKLI